MNGITMKTKIVEEFDSIYNKILNSDKVSITLIPSRLQPPHNGHKFLISQSKYSSYLAVVRGEKTSTNKDRNPFSYELQEKLIEELEFNTLYGKFNNFNLPEIYTELLNQGYIVKEIICGDDRYDAYQKMVNDYESENNWDIEVTSFKRDKDSSDIDGISSTLVKSHLANNNKDAVKELMTGITDETYFQMYSAINNK